MNKVNAWAEQIKRWSPFRMTITVLLMAIAAIIYWRDFSAWSRLGYGQNVASLSAFSFALETVFAQNFIRMVFLAAIASWLLYGYRAVRNLVLGVAPDEEDEKPGKKKARSKEAEDATQVLDSASTHREAIRAKQMQSVVQLVPNSDGSIGPIPVLAPADADEAAFADQAT